MVTVEKNIKYSFQILAIIKNLFTKITKLIVQNKIILWEEHVNEDLSIDILKVLLRTLWLIFSNNLATKLQSHAAFE